jgi:radical SAM additional 4Fe4S-binding domain
MRCRYCFYHAEAEARERFSHGIMSAETVNVLIDKAFLHAGGNNVSFAFQGGEPLLAGKDYFRHFVEKVNEKNVNGSKVFYSVQTNGTLIDDEWAEFFMTNGFLLGVSLDGNQKYNAKRRLSDDAFAFGKTMDGIDILTKHGVNFNILCVLTRDIAENIGSVYEYFKSKGFKYLQFTPYLKPFDKTTDDEYYVPPKIYAAFLIRLFNLYVKDYVKGDYTSVRSLDNFVQIYLGNGAEQCGMNGHCAFCYVIEGDGDVYPCDFYCLDEYRLGNIKDTTFDALEKSTRERAFIEESLIVPDKCRVCKYIALCGKGGCKRYKVKNDYCEAYKTFFDACLPLFSVFKNAR